jgi:UDP-N-acetylmuramyl pentapeptide synthase
MLELGAPSRDLHREVGRHLARINDRCGVDRAMLIGHDMEHAATEAAQTWSRSHITTFPTLSDEAIAGARKMIRRGDAVLV